MVTSAALTPAVAMVAATYTFIVAVFTIVPLMGASVATRHFTGHVLHAIVLTMNTMFALLVLYEHDELKQTMRNLLKFGKTITKAKNNKILPVEHTEQKRVEEPDNNEGDRYYASLAKDWSIGFQRSEMA